MPGVPAVSPTPEELAEQRGGTRRVMVGVKLWPSTIGRLQAKADARYPDDNPKRRMSPYMRDLLALGEAAEAAGYVPGDPIPAKRKRANP